MGAWYVEVCRDLRLEEKRDCVPTPVTQEQQVSQYLLMLCDSTLVVSSSKKMNNINKDVI